MRLIVISLALLFFCQEAKSQESEQPMNFVNYFIGNTMIGVNKDGNEYSIFYSEDGKVVFNLINGFWDKGTWCIDGDRLCITWEKIRDGATACIRDFREVGNNTFSIYNEFYDRDMEVRLEQGNFDIYALERNIK